MKKYINLDEPWAVMPEAFFRLKENSNIDIEALTSGLGDKFEDKPNLTIRDNVAIIQIRGAMQRYDNIWAWFFGLSSYEKIISDFMTVLDNPNIKAIIFDIDSPGGEVNGCAELSDLIYKARSKKEIIAYASGDCCSGAYWIASSCKKIISSKTSAVGSIGVVGSYRLSNNDDLIEIVSTQSPDKRLDVKSDDGKIKIQNRIDKLADVFINSVAKYRNVSTDIVKADYGQGGVYIGDEAVNKGLIDELGNLEDLILNYASNDGAFFMGENKVDMNLLKEKHSNLANELISEGMSAERERLKEIMSLEEYEGREELAKHFAFDSNMKVSDIQNALKLSPKKEDKKQELSSFEKVMNGIKNPEIMPDVDDEVNEEEAIAKRIANY